MGALIVISTFINGAILAYIIGLPLGTPITETISNITIVCTVLFMFSFGALIVWTDHVREFYNRKSGPFATFVKIITFPIWLFGVMFCAWAMYETAKDVRNWMHKND